MRIGSRRAASKSAGAGRGGNACGAPRAALPLHRRHLDRLDAKFGPYLGKRRVAALGLDLRHVPLAVGTAICVGELHLFLLTPLHHALRCGTLPTEPVKGLISTREALPMRCRASSR